jgi:hypothetical protein
MIITIIATAIYIVSSEVLTRFASGEAVGAGVAAVGAIEKNVSVFAG